MSGFHKGKAAIPAKTERRPWEKKYRTGLTPLRSRAMPGPVKPALALVASVVGFKAKPGLGGRRHRLRRARLAVTP